MSFTEAVPPRSEPGPEAGQGNAPTARQFFGLLAGYFTLQIVARVLVSGSADLDESEQLILTQKLSWGYGSQPPLYTWVQFLFFKLFGVSIFSLALLKNLFLFCTYFFTYLNARFITRSHACGVAAAAALLFIPQIAWESQRDLTHSVLASAFALATLICFFRLHERRDLRMYVLFGICAGLGLLSKYNYALLLVGLLVAAVRIPELRPAVLDKRMLLAGLILVVILLPNAWWIWQHWELAFQAAGKFHIERSAGWLAGVGAGLGSLFKSTATFICPLALVFGLIFWRRTGASPAPKSVHTRLLLHLVVFMYAALILAVLAVRVTDIRDRWLQPILICVPVLAMALLQERFSLARLKRLLIAAVVVMIVIGAAIPGRILLAERMHRTEPLSRPFTALARQVERSIEPAAVLVADTKLLAGNLRLNLPGKIATTPDLAGLFVEPGVRCALVWEAPATNGPAVGKKDGRRSFSPPESLRDFAKQTGASDLDETRAEYFCATFRYHRSRQMCVSVLAVP